MAEYPGLTRMRSQMIPEFQNDPEMKQIADEYITELAVILDKIKESIDSGDIETTTRYAHMIRGSAGTYGLMEFGELAGILENACKGRSEKPTVAEAWSRLLSSVELV